MYEKELKKIGPKFYFIFRVIVGLLFALHGAQKFGLFGGGNVPGFASAVGIAVWIAYVIATIELLGGLAILLGFYTRLAALITGLEMLLVLIRVHFPQGINPLTNGGELALLFLVSFLILSGYGPGRYSLNKE